MVMVRAGRRLPVVRDAEAPRTRAECPETRPCPWVACRYHLLVDVGRGQRRDLLLKARYFREDRADQIVAALEAMPDTCALDVAERGALSDGEIGELIGVTRQRAEQIVFMAGVRLRGALACASDDMLKHGLMLRKAPRRNGR